MLPRHPMLQGGFISSIYSFYISPLDQEINNSNTKKKKNNSLFPGSGLPSSSQHPTQSSQHIPAQRAEHFTQWSSARDEHTELSVLRQL